MAETTKTPDQLEAEIEELRTRLKGLEADRTHFHAVESQLETTLLDLSVHQEELRTQNEELIGAREAADVAARKYSLLFEHSPLAYLLIDENQIVQEANFMATSLLKAEKWALIGKPLLSFIDKGDRDLYWSHLRQVFQNGEKASDTFLLHPKKGDPVPVQITSQIVDDPERERGLSLTIIFDLSERKRIEDELQESVAMLQATLESTADGILVVDQEGKISRFNRRFQEIWEIPDAIMAAGDDDAALDHALARLEDSDAFLKKVRDLYDTPEEESFDVLKFRDGTVLERFSRPERIEDEIVGRVWSFRDVTDRVNAENDLKRSNAELEQFAYIASHDLQEPLRTVTNYTQLLERRYGDQLDGDAGETLDFIVDAAKHMRALIRDLLEFSRIRTQAGERKATPSTVAIEEALTNLRASIEETKGTVTYNGLPVVVADHSQLVRLFQNLIGNSLKYRHPDRFPQIHITAEESGLEQVFSVKDNGIGIDPEYHDRIFLIFKRLHAQDQHEGTGLGLAVCKKIVHRHGGTIWVESEPENGATFSFTLPGVPDL